VSFSAKPASKKRTWDVQAVQPHHGLVGLVPWSCQVQLGVMMKSPGAWWCARRRPRVYAPEPSTMKRSALCVWRWLGADLAGQDQLQAGA
jgi:hypothetical protein